MHCRDHESAAWLLKWKAEGVKGSAAALPRGGCQATNALSRADLVCLAEGVSVTEACGQQDCSLPDILNLPSPIVVVGRATLPVPSCTELCPGDSGEEGTCITPKYKLGCEAPVLPSMLQHGHPVSSMKHITC